MKDVKYTGKNKQTLEELLEQMRADELVKKKEIANMLRREEEERCKKLGCFLIADDMINYVLNGGIMVANYEINDRIYYDKEHDIVVHDGPMYDDGTGKYYKEHKTETVEEFKAWCYRCEKHNKEQDEPDKYFNPYWNPIENVSPANGDEH